MLYIIDEADDVSQVITEKIRQLSERLQVVGGVAPNLDYLARRLAHEKLNHQVLNESPTLTAQKFSSMIKEFQARLPAEQEPPVSTVPRGFRGYQPSIKKKVNPFLIQSKNKKKRIK